MVLFLLDFWNGASIMSEEITQLDFACNGEENEEQIYKLMQISLP